jgi:hypothetical protein
MLFQAGSSRKDLMFLKKAVVKQLVKPVFDVSISFDHAAGAGSWVELM